MYYRPCTVHDYSEVLLMLQEAAKSLQNRGIDQWSYWLSPPAYKQSWLRAGVDRGEYYFLLDHDDHIVGMYRLAESDLEYWGAQDIAAYYVHSLVVRPAFAGQGYGQRMLRDIEAAALTAGMQVLRLDCHAGNARLCRYYTDLGYVKVGEKQMPHSLNNLYEKVLAQDTTAS